MFVDAIPLQPSARKRWAKEWFYQGMQNMVKELGAHGSQSCHQRVLVRDPRDALASLLSTALFEGGGRGLGFKVFRI